MGSAIADGTSDIHSDTNADVLSYRYAYADADSDSQPDAISHADASHL